MPPDDIDLYKDDLAAPEDKELYAAVEVFARIASPQPERTQEGYLLDFKGTWSDSALRAVAAFANTFGGLLLIGVTDEDGRADELVGVPSQRHELKTRIASSIASNISPTPSYNSAMLLSLTAQADIFVLSASAREIIFTFSPRRVNHRFMCAMKTRAYRLMPPAYRHYLPSARRRAGQSPM